MATAIPIGSLIRVPLPATGQLAIAEVTSDYCCEDAAELQGFHHVRSVRWNRLRDRGALPPKVQVSLGSLSTPFQPKGAAQLLALAALQEIPPLPDDEVGLAGVSALDGLETALGDVFPEQPADREDAAALVGGAGDRSALGASLKAKAQTEVSVKRQVAMWAHRGYRIFASHELGPVISTADFALGARVEAEAPGKAPVSLTGGSQAGRADDRSSDRRPSDRDDDLRPRTAAHRPRWTN